MKTIVIITVSFITGFIVGYSSINGPAPRNSEGNGNGYKVQGGIVTQEFDTDTLPDKINSNLERELLDANEEISYLSELNQSLTNLIAQYNLPISASTTYTTLLERIDMLSDGFIKQQLTNLFEADYISTIDNPHEFSKSLVEIALSQEQGENFSGSANIVFSYSPIEGWRELATEATIDRFDTLYAHISSTQDMMDAMVKWQHVESGEILLFIPISLAAMSQSQYVVVRPDNGWYKGRYQVTIHDMDNSGQLVAANSFELLAVKSDNSNQNASGPDADILQDLIITGRAIPKNYQ